MSKPTATEKAAQQFIETYGPIVESSDTGPITVRLIARDGTILGIELASEVEDAGRRLSQAYRRTTALYSEGAEPVKMAAVESSIPHLKETYQRKLDLSLRLGDLTDRAMELAEGTSSPPATGVGEAFALVDDDNNTGRGPVTPHGWSPDPGGGESQPTDDHPSTKALESALNFNALLRGDYKQEKEGIARVLDWWKRVVR